MTYWLINSVSAIFGDVLEPRKFNRHPMFRISTNAHVLAWAGLINMDGSCEDLRTSIRAVHAFIMSRGSSVADVLFGSHRGVGTDCRVCLFLI